MLGLEHPVSLPKALSPSNGLNPFIVPEKTLKSSPPIKPDERRQGVSFSHIQQTPCRVGVHRTLSAATKAADGG
jgi:hypothetical protein